MSNGFDCGVMERPTGWIAWYRRLTDAQNIVLRDGKLDIIYATEGEAWAAAKDKLCSTVNSPCESFQAKPPSVKSLKAAAANRAFKSGMVETIKQKNSERRVIIERRGVR
ncbi:hypothetical protein IFT84_17560 [Rhizobium sp. CFBP 8762]|uniref:hypothetical protein n=1 Tax=Rhizobium sp. CFBP 8762 TaxID=2775279 RepID=UPI00177B5C1A|nr:hypothetical protein [Rhizobium sp. CFBP 8762]MBD8556318.1 hypothetical protein [Rhizobium sp. CFBP 8762]